MLGTTKTFQKYPCWCRKSPVSYTVLMSAQHKTRRPQESTGVLSAKDPPIVKLENSLQLYSARTGINYAYLNLWGFWSFYSSVELTFISWQKGSFLMGKILIKVRILQDPFHITILLIRVSCEAQDISFLSFLRISWTAWRSCDPITVHIAFVTLSTVLHHVNVTWLCHRLDCTHPSSCTSFRKNPSSSILISTKKVLLLMFDPVEWDRPRSFYPLQPHLA